MIRNRRWTLARRPKEDPQSADFHWEETGISESLGDSEILARNLYLSLDPYMRWRMNEEKSYAPPVAIGDVMVGATISEVVRSRDPRLKSGDHVVGSGGWQDYSVLQGSAVRKLTPGTVDAPAYLSMLGSPGFTAYAGLMKIGVPAPGETVVVGAATGPVGSMVGQLAKRAGCHVVAIAGGPEKCRIAREAFGFDAAVDHRDGDLAGALANACPDGIDIYFENIGGRVLDAVIPLLNEFARIPVCGVVSQYNGVEARDDETPLSRLARDILVKRLMFRGFIVTDFAGYMSEFLDVVAPLVRDGSIARLEEIVNGLEAAPEAFIGLLKGRNRGKLIIRIA